MSQDSRRLAIEQLQQGMHQQRAGQVSLALSHYQRAAKLDPNHPQAWYMLGMCALHSGNLALAAKHLRTCLSIDANSAEAHNSLGVVLRRSNRHDEAIAEFRNALELRENYANAAYNLGLSLESTQHLGDAESAFRQALRGNESDFNANNALGTLLHRMQRPDEAVAYLRNARRVQPDNAHVNGTLARVLVDLAHAHEALGYAQTATAIEPAVAAWWAARGRAERLVHDVGAAIVSLRRAIALAPEDWISRCELGLALAEAGEIEESRNLLSSTRVGLHVAERLRWTVLLSLPSVYVDEAHVDAERERYARGLDDIATHLHLETPEQRGYALEAARGVAPFQLDYQARDNTALHCRFGDLITRVAQAAVPARAQALPWRACAHGGRIRVGILSSHLMNHTVSRYFRQLLAALDTQRFEVTVWYSGETRDFSTEYIATRVARFEQVGGDVLRHADRVVAAQLDALIYPEIGMDPFHHLLGALRLAPVQCVLYGHPATSGLATIDYFIGADALEPADAQEHYREKLVRLPGLGTLPQRPEAPGDGRWLDAFADNAPLALCLQNHLKLPPAFDAVLARIAQRSGARMGFFIRNSGVAERFRQRIQTAFQALGLDPAQTLRFLPSQDYPSYLGAVARATLILDTPGFSGGATSLDAFHVGAPVLTWKQSMARGRQTAGMLAMMGIDGLVANDAQDYIDKAVKLIADAPQRESLRQRILDHNHVLFDGVGVIAALEDFLDVATRQAASI